MDQQLEEQMRKNIQSYIEVLKISGAHQIMKTSWGPLNLLQSSTHFYINISKKCKNEKVNATYLSKTMYDELIEIMGKNVQDKFVNQINNLHAKY